MQGAASVPALRVVIRAMRCASLLSSCMRRKRTQCSSGNSAMDGPPSREAGPNEAVGVGFQGTRGRTRTACGRWSIGAFQYWEERRGGETLNGGWVFWDDVLRMDRRMGSRTSLGRRISLYGVQTRGFRWDGLWDRIRGGTTYRQEDLVGQDTARTRECCGTVLGRVDIVGHGEGLGSDRGWMGHSWRSLS